MAKRLSAKNKAELVKNFILGKTIDQLSQEFECTKLTISRNLKKTLGEEKYKEVSKKIKLSNKPNCVNEKDTFESKNNQIYENDNSIKNYDYNDHFSNIDPFMEITPLELNIDNSTQKDLSSVPIEEVTFPKITYMIVDKNIELQIKFLKDYPDWQFLSQDELNRKTIEVFFDLKTAKRFCNKEQKVIKVPNTNVFKIVAPLLVSRGISRIVSQDKLIAL